MKKEHRGDPPQTKPTNNEYSQIEINLIDAEGQSVREAMNDDHVVELAMSLAKHGLLQPIVVRQNPSGRYQLEAGFHRLAAAARLGWTHIPAHIRFDTSSPVKAIALIENIVRKNMTLDEEVRATTYLNQEEKLSPSSICDLLGKSRLWVDQRLSIPNYPEDVKQELLDGNLSIGKAETLANVEDPGTRAFILNQVISSKLTTKQTKDLVQLYLATPSIQSAVEAGLQKKAEIQATPKTYKKCELCQRIVELADIKFITVCTDTISCNQTMIHDLKMKGEEDHAS